jgi:hypothetical protein
LEQIQPFHREMFRIYAEACGRRADRDAAFNQTLDRHLALLAERYRDE